MDQILCLLVELVTVLLLILEDHYATTVLGLVKIDVVIGNDGDSAIAVVLVLLDLILLMLLLAPQLVLEHGIDIAGDEQAAAADEQLGKE